MFASEALTSVWLSSGGLALLCTLLRVNLGGFCLPNLAQPQYLKKVAKSKHCC